jgi:hypothetical protein
MPNWMQCLSNSMCTLRRVAWFKQFCRTFVQCSINVTTVTALHMLVSALGPSGPISIIQMKAAQSQRQWLPRLQGSSPHRIQTSLLFCIKAVTTGVTARSAAVAFSQCTSEFCTRNYNRRLVQTGSIHSSVKSYQEWRIRNAKAREGTGCTDASKWLEEMCDDELSLKNKKGGRKKGITKKW